MNSREHSFDESDFDNGNISLSDSQSNVDHASSKKNTTKITYKLSPDQQIDLDSIFDRQKRDNKTRVKNSLRRTFWDFDVTPKTILYTGAGDLADHLDTYLRTFQVYTNIYKNFVETGVHNFDGQNPNAEYYQWFTGNGEGTALTGLGIGAAAATFAGLPLGMGREWYRNYHKENVDSLDWLNENIDALNVGGHTFSTFFDEIKNENDREDYTREDYTFEYYKRMIGKKKVVNRARIIKEDNVLSHASALDDFHISEKNAFLDFLGVNYDTTNGKEKRPWYEIIIPIMRALLEIVSNYLLNDVRALFGDFHISERNVVFDFLGVDYDTSDRKEKRHWSLVTISAISIFLKRVWDYLNDNAYTYWLVWFPVASIIGVSAASASVLFAPIVISLTLSFGLMYQIPKIINWVTNQWKGTNDEVKEAIRLKKQNDEKKAELDRMGAELKYRHFMHVEHRIQEAYLLGLNKARKPVKVDVQKQAYEELTQEEVENSELGKYLLDGDSWLQNSKLRIVLGVATEFVNAVIMTAFSAWIISAVIFSFGGAIPAFLFFDSMFNSGIAGLVIGVISGTKRALDMVSARNDYKARIVEVLNERVEKTGETKLECFERLEKEIEFGKARAEWRRIQVLIKNQNAKNYSEFDINDNFSQINVNSRKEYYTAKYAELKALRVKYEKRFSVPAMGDAMKNSLAGDYDIDKINVYNHEFREKQRYTAGVWTTIKRWFNRIYTVLAGGQTGSLLARSLFLKGCLLGVIAGGGIAVGVTTGTLPIFISIAIVVAAAYAGIKLLQYHNEREHQHRDKFLENMDGNIAYLKKKNKELALLNQHLTIEAGSQQPHNGLLGATEADLHLSSSFDILDDDDFTFIDDNHSNTNENYLDLKTGQDIDGTYQIKSDDMKATDAIEQVNLKQSKNNAKSVKFDFKKTQNDSFKHLPKFSLMGGHASPMAVMKNDYKTAPESFVSRIKRGFAAAVA